MTTKNYLTDRELEVLNLLSCGKSTPEIATHLFLSTETIKTYRKNLITKLDAKNVANLIRLAYDNGIFKAQKSIDKINYHFKSQLEMVA